MCLKEGLLHQGKRFEPAISNCLQETTEIKAHNRTSNSPRFPLSHKARQSTEEAISEPGAVATGLPGQ